jgi:hypothetical protein
MWDEQLDRKALGEALNGLGVRLSPADVEYAFECCQVRLQW